MIMEKSSVNGKIIGNVICTWEYHGKDPLQMGRSLEQIMGIHGKHGVCIHPISWKSNHNELL